MKLDNQDIDDLSDDITEILELLSSGDDESTTEFCNNLIPYVSDIDTTINNDYTNEASSLLTDTSNYNSKLIGKVLNMLDKGLHKTHINLFTILFKAIAVNDLY